MILTCSQCGQKNRVKAEHLAGATRCGKCKEAITPVARPIDADPESFDDVLRHAPVPVLVDFWAAWCGPCRMAAPEVERVAGEMAGRAIVLKVDTDQHGELGARYNVRGIPNVLVLKNGRVLTQQAGVVSSAQMKRWLEAASSAVTV